MKKLLLLDGDIFAFQAASAVEAEHWWDDETVTLESDLAAAKRVMKSNIKRVLKELRAKEAILCLSCKSRKYFRHGLLPSYKGGRTSRPPLVLKELKEWAEEEYETVIIENLEADDVMGIKATDPDYYPKHRKIIVSIDKDMKTIPAWIFNPDEDYKEWLQNEEDANRWHLKQALMGDQTDCYIGCKGMGETAVDSWIKEPWKYVQNEHIFKSGKRKGESEMRWSKVEPDGLGEGIKGAYYSLFEKAGQTKQDALIMWTVARILRHSDYDYLTQKINIPFIG